MIAENNTYFLHVGPRVDVAFLVLATFAIDELFTDDWLSIIDPINIFTTYPDNKEVFPKIWLYVWITSDVRYSLRLNFQHTVLAEITTHKARVRTEYKSKYHRGGSPALTYKYFILTSFDLASEMSELG